MTRPPLPYVTDHAVLRYLQRREGVDVEATRRRIADLVRRGVERGGRAVVVDGVKFVLEGSNVVTVIDRRWPAQSRPEGSDA